MEFVFSEISDLGVALPYSAQQSAQPGQSSTTGGRHVSYCLPMVYSRHRVPPTGSPVQQGQMHK